MKASADRILTTHVGSLPRHGKLADVLAASLRDNTPPDPATVYALSAEAVADVCRRQQQAGVDVMSDGEQSKVGFATYIRERLTGFEPRSDRIVPRQPPQDMVDFPDFLQAQLELGAVSMPQFAPCVGPISYVGQEPLKADLTNFKRALAGTEAVEGFLPAASPGCIAGYHYNEHYESHEAYLYAIADAMKVEYDAIVDAGFVLQLDCPDLTYQGWAYLADFPGGSHRDLHVEALNHALRDLPGDRLRLHLCFSNYDGPHNHDAPIQDLMPHLFKAKPQGLAFEAANPRHAHEWQAWQDADIPDDKILIPGVVESTNNFIEHPELIAQRLSNYAAAVGRERVIAGTDCGFATFVGGSGTHPSIAWAKLESLAAGAARASEQLWP